MPGQEWMFGLTEAPFVGMHTAATVVSADPSALNNTVGFCIDAGDLEQLVLTRGTAATKRLLG
jgi:hypothetical protein